MSRVRMGLLFRPRGIKVEPLTPSCHRVDAPHLPFDPVRAADARLSSKVEGGRMRQPLSRLVCWGQAQGCMVLQACRRLEPPFSRYRDESPHVFPFACCLRAEKHLKRPVPLVSRI
jgi:hypothetical protein